MNKRLTMALAVGALVVAMVPGVASAKAPSAEASGGCYDSDLAFGKIRLWWASTEAQSFGQVLKAYRTEARTCPNGGGQLIVNGELVASFNNG